MPEEKVYRIGEKLVSLEKALHLIERILELREQGISQQETARRMQIDRSFVSRLESVGEIRKGRRIAVIGFPLANKDEIARICSANGLEFYLLMNDRERWDMVRDTKALDFFNQMLDLVARLREYDSLVMITSEKWHKMAEALLNIQIINISLGSTPIREDRLVDPHLVEKRLQQLMTGEGKEDA